MGVMEVSSGFGWSLVGAGGVDFQTRGSNGALLPSAAADVT